MRVVMFFTDDQLFTRITYDDHVSATAVADGIPEDIIADEPIVSVGGEVVNTIELLQAMDKVSEEFSTALDIINDRVARVAYARGKEARGYQPLVIELVRSADGFRANLRGDKLILANGTSISEAIGEFVRVHADRLNIKIERMG